MGHFPTVGQSQIRQDVGFELFAGRFTEQGDRFTDSGMNFSGDLVFCFNAHSRPPAAGGKNSNPQNHEY